MDREQPSRLSRRERLRRIFLRTHWPFFVWTRVPPGDFAHSGAIRSVVHTGYTFSAVALVLDGLLWFVFGLPGSPLFLLGHLVWISLLISILLLNPRFLEHLDGTPLRGLGLPNWLTISRALLLPVLLYLVWLREWLPALLGYVLLGLTDVADGAVARRSHQESKLGFVFDPFVDILFHLGILLSMVAVGVLSRLTGALVLARYALLLVGCAALYEWKGEIWIQPTPFGKATGLTIATLTGLLMLLMGSGLARRPLVRGIDRILTVLFAAGVIHAIVIGWINFRRPPQGGTAVYRKGWGLLVGRRPAPAQRKGRRGTGGSPMG